MELKVMTFNIRHGRGMDDAIDLKRISQVIKQSKADIIGLNEVDKYYSERSYYEDQVKWLGNELNMYHAYSPSVSLTNSDSNEPREYGNALLSRYPIKNAKIHHFNFIKGLIEGRSLLEALIKIDGYQVNVYVTHLSLNPFLHRKQTGSLIEIFQNNSNPVIVMGDWNMRERSRAWRKMTSLLKDAWKEGGNGSGKTYPSNRPRSRLDYIFVSDHFRIAGTEVNSNIPNASDHLPVITTLSIK